MRAALHLASFPQLRLPRRLAAAPVLIASACLALCFNGCQETRNAAKLPSLLEVWYYHPEFLKEGGVYCDWWIDIERVEEIDDGLLVTGKRVNYWNANGTI